MPRVLEPFRLHALSNRAALLPSFQRIAARSTTTTARTTAFSRAKSPESSSPPALAPLSHALSPPPCRHSLHRRPWSAVCSREVCPSWISMYRIPCPPSQTLALSLDLGPPRVLHRSPPSSVRRVSTGAETNVDLLLCPLLLREERDCRSHVHLHLTDHHWLSYWSASCPPSQAQLECAATRAQAHHQVTGALQSCSCSRCDPFPAIQKMLQTSSQYIHHWQAN
uniref:Uncharacterized protein n=1 Tax=Arundo donax TaxID=35708 RepID=A0A0A9CUZ7_ARUDO